MVHEPDTSPLQPGTTIDQYLISAVLGRSTFAITYLVLDQMLQRNFVLREFFPEGLVSRDGVGVRVKGGPGGESAYREGLRRFYGEARLLATVAHPSIVGVRRVFEANNSAYVLVDYVEGRTLEAWLGSLDSPPTQEELDLIVTPLLNALQLLHERSALHLEISPHNVMVRSNDGAPLLMHFSGGRVTGTDGARLALHLTPYTAPELYTSHADRDGPWTDIYSFGAMLYRAISGHPPAQAPMRQIGEEETKPARVVARGRYRPEFLSAIDWALSLPPSDRPQSIKEWRARLLVGDIVMRETVVMPRSSHLERSPEPPDAPARGVGGALGSAALFVVGLPVLVVGAAISGAAALAKKMRPGPATVSGNPASARTAPGVPSPAAVSADTVQCSIFAPPSAAPGATFLVQVFLHAPDEAGKVEVVARAFDDASAKRQYATLATPVTRGGRVDVSLEGAGLEIAEPHRFIVWRGDTEPANFLVRVPAGAGVREFFPVVLISIDGVPHGRLVFKLSVQAGAGSTEAIHAGLAATPYRRAFCSYSAQDAAEVTRCVQVLNALGYDCFHDKSSLKPGQSFEQALCNEVRQRELFLLFWSRAAQQSAWVRKEAQWAVEAQTGSRTRMPDILPIILEGPPPPQPFPFLSDRHFDDRFQYMISALRAPRPG